MSLCLCVCVCVSVCVCSYLKQIMCTDAYVNIFQISCAFVYVFVGVVFQSDERWLKKCRK